MTLPSGSRIGSYEVRSLLGEGGMGVVYRAHDTKLGREVALKVLPEALTGDTERLARLEREAKLLASMNHPAIASVYGIEESRDGIAVVMELVEGRTLAEHLSEGPLPPREALSIARQVCEALEAAHARGIVHRDLKPGNVMVRADGRVSVLDFGLAKPTSPATGDGSGSDPEAVAGRIATRSETLLGTPPYMSPEQLEGRAADPRTDIWALGCLLYEMLVGRSPFARSTVWQTVAATLGQEPDLTRLPSATPARVRLLTERCLRKDPGKRLHHVADARIEIDEAIAEGEASGWTSRRAALASPIAVGLASVAIIAALALAWTWSRDGPAGASTSRTEPISFGVPLPPGHSLGPGEVSTYIAVSPDGRMLAFGGSFADSPLRLYEFGTGTTRVVAGTEGAASPFWSPDSRLIGFFAGGQLKKVGVEGQPPQVISAATWEAGNSWGADGTILFAQPTSDGIAIHRVRAEGGDPSPVTSVDRGREVAHFWPEILPDGRHFLYLSIERSPDPVPQRTLYLASLDGGEPRPLLTSVSRAEYVPPGVLLYVTEGVLVAHRFDAGRLELVGEPRPVTDRLRHFYMTGQAEFSASHDAHNPVVAFHGGAWTSEVVRYDRAGQRLGPLAEPAAYDQVRISPDGRQAVVDVLDPTNGGRDLWVYDLVTTRARRMTLHRADEQDPVWSADGTRILYRSDENGPPDLYVRSAAGSGEPRRLLSRPTVLTPEDWSSDGRHVIYQVSDRTTGADQWIVDLEDEETEPRPLLDTPYAEWGGRFSPDGRWVAFVSNEAGTSDVYVAPVDDPGARRAVSTDGGIAPRWRSDGDELFYLGPGRTVMAVDVRWGPALELGGPRVLFELDGPVYASAFDVSPDGELFLVNQVIEDASSAPIQVRLNWPAAAGLALPDGSNAP